MKVLNAGNYFHEKGFNEICAALENGEAVEVYIDVIGHSRNNQEQEVYKEELQLKYGDRLQVERVEGGFSYSYQYSLK